MKLKLYIPFAERETLIDDWLSASPVKPRYGKKNEREEKDKDYHLVERSYGSFTRSVELPAGVNLDSIKAVMSKGVLKVTVPKPAPSQVKKIDVKSAA